VELEEVVVTEEEEEDNENDTFVDDMFADDMFVDDMFADDMFADWRTLDSRESRKSLTTEASSKLPSNPSKRLPSLYKLSGPSKRFA